MGSEDPDVVLMDEGIAQLEREASEDLREECERIKRKNKKDVESLL